MKRKRKLKKNEKINMSFGMSIAALAVGATSLLYAKITNGAIAEVLQNILHKDKR